MAISFELALAALSSALGIATAAGLAYYLGKARGYEEGQHSKIAPILEALLEEKRGQ